MENEKSNKLIAEFMGIDSQILSTGNIHSWSDSPFYYITKDSKEKVMKGISEYSKYHTSWDWLMPVVEKIKDMGYDQELNEIDNVLTCDLRIDYLHHEVVEFIKWHNEQTNK